MTTPIHRKQPDAISIFTTAKMEHIPYISARARAAAGVYGPTFKIGKVLCASVSELKKRGIIKDGQQLPPTPRQLARCLWMDIFCDLVDSDAFSQMDKAAIIVLLDRSNKKFKLGITADDLLPDNLNPNKNADVSPPGRTIERVDPEHGANTKTPT